MSSKENISVWLTINRACNLRCDWCYAKHTGFSSKDDMSENSINKSLKLLIDLRVKSVILIGGEPTMHPDFFSIVSKFASSGIKVKMLTNAIKFSDEKFLLKSLEAGIGSIAISFKASNRKNFVKFTGRDYFKKSTLAIRNINKHGISNAVNMTACKDSFSNFQEMIDVVAASGGKNISIDTGRPVILGDNVISTKGMGMPKEMADFFVSIYPLLKKSSLEFSFKVGIPLCLFPKDFLEMIIKERIILSGCQMAMGKGLIIDTDSRIIPCNHLCHVSLGSVGKDFSDAKGYWRFRKRKDVASFYNFNKLCPSERCVGCEYWKFCGGGCKLYWLCYGDKEMIGNFV